MKRILTLLTLSVSVTAFAQINIQWGTRYSNSGNNPDRAVELVRDNAGNVYVTGTSWNGSNYDIVTVKYDPAGAQQWTASYNGAGNGFDEARGVAVDNNGFVYACGYTQGLSSNYNYVAVKYDVTNGAQQWAATYDGPNNGFDESYDIAADASGNVYVTGSSASGTTGVDFATVKYNSAGVQQWATRYSNNTNANNVEAAYAIAVDAGGFVYVTGMSYGNSTTDYDIATIKYNNGGTQQWVTRYNGPGSKLDYPNRLIVDGSGNVYVTGSQRALTGVTNYDVITIKYNSAGAQQWATPYAGAGNEDDRGNAIALLSNNDVVITGRSIGTSATAEDIVTIRYNGTSGAQSWEKRYDGGVVNFDEGTDLAIDALDNIYVTGYSYGSGTNNNYITIKYDSNSAQQWLTRYQGPASNGNDQAFSIKVDNIGNLYVTGVSKGVSTGEDYYTIKYCQLTTSASSDTAICLGDAVQLTGAIDFGTIDSAWWLPASGLSTPNTLTTVASPSATTTYVLAVRNQYGCVDRDTITVVVNPLPGPVINTSGPASFCAGDSVTLTAATTSPSTYLWTPGGQTTQSVTVFTSGTYSVTVSDTNTCSAQSTIVITANALPTVSAGSDINLCTSSSQQICATGAASYAWSPSFGVSDTTIACPTFGPTSSTTYIVTGTDANGCTDTDTVNITLLPPPPVPNIFVSFTDLHATPGYASYQWYFNSNPISGATDSIYTPTQNGNYYVVVTDANGCSSFSGTFVMNEVGIVTYAALSDLQLFPNPNNGSFTLVFDATGEAAQLRITDMTGRVVLEKNYAASGRTTDMLSLEGEAAGLYFAKLTSPRGESVLKISVVK